jgi:hypothetical protein
MDVGNPDFRFTHLHKDNKEEKDGKPIREPARAELHIDSLDRFHNNSTGVPATVQSQQLAKLIGPTKIRAGTIPQEFGPSSLVGNNFVVSGKNSRNLIYGYFERIALTQIQLFYRTPNVISPLDFQWGNGLIYFNYYQVTGTNNYTQSFIIPTGNYSPASLALYLQGAIRGWPGLTPTAVTVTFTNGRFIFQTNIVGDTISVAPYGQTVPGGPGTDELFNSAHYKMCKMLGLGASGFGQGPTAVGGPSGQMIGYTPNMNFTDYVDICSSTLTKYKRVKDTNSTDLATQDVIARIYISGNNTSSDPTTNAITPNQYYVSGTALATIVAPITYAQIINASWITPNFNKWSPEEALSSVDFKLRDMYGNPLYWTSENNTEFQATLTVSET